MYIFGTENRPSECCRYEKYQWHKMGCWLIEGEGVSSFITRELPFDMQENQELKAENSTLIDKVTNLSLITSDLNNKVKENENERLSACGHGHKINTNGPKTSRISA